jgi:hypothetical protein
LYTYTNAEKEAGSSHSHQKHHESLSLKGKTQGKRTQDEQKAFMTG